MATLSIAVVPLLSLAAWATVGTLGYRQTAPYAMVKHFFGVSGGNLPQQETLLLIRNILYRVKCDQAGIDCSKCLNIDSVLGYLNRSQERTLDEASFYKLSVILVVFMKDVANECSQSEISVGRKQLSVSEFSARLTGNTPKFTPSTLTDLLRFINEKYRFGSLVLNSTGVVIPEQSEVIDFTTDFQCFSPKSLYRGMNKSQNSELNSSDIQLLAGYIVLNVLEGHCISLDDKPSPYSFLADLFSMFGDKAKTMLDHEEFENLLEALNIGPQKHNRPNPTAKAKRALNRSVSWQGQLASDAQLISNAFGICVQKNCSSTATSLRVLVENVTAILNTSKLQNVCPTLIERLLTPLLKEKEENSEATTLTEAYGYGALATGVISISPLIGILCLKIPCSRARSYVLAFLMALGVSALTGDAVLHLLPQATGLKSSPSADGVLKGFAIDPSLLTMAAVLGSFYLFTTLQMVLGVVWGSHCYKANSEGHDLSTSDKSGETLERQMPNTGVVRMVILGDAVHNFVDGLALATAFTAGVSSGLSSAIAILCHELPHEIGDFSTLLSAGLPMKRALLMTFVSGLTAFVGLAIGVPLAGNTGGQHWAFAITAGVFLYVSLANVIPELLKQAQSSSCVWLTFGVIHMGMLLGYGVIFTIAIFEEQIVF